MFRNMPLGMLSKSTTLREKLRLALVGEFEGVDIDIEEVTVISEKNSSTYVRGMLDSFNLKVGAWTLPFSIDAEEKVFDEGMKKIERYAQVAKEINSLRVLGTVSSPDKTKADTYRQNLTSIIKILGRYGCTIGLDCPGMCQTQVENTGIILNASQWHLSGGNLEELKKIDWNRVVYVKMGDVGANKTGKFLPGETGVVDLAGFLKILSDVGYGGPVTPQLPDRNLLTLPEELAVRLLGGSLLKVWNKSFPNTNLHSKL